MPVTRARRGPVALAVALLAGVAIAAWQVTLIPEPTVGVGVGPRSMLAALVALLVGAVLRHRFVRHDRSLLRRMA